MPQAQKPATTTIELLDQAIGQATSERELSRQLGLASNTLGTARSKGHLSPAIAAILSDYLGHSAKEAAMWCLLAVSESKHNESMRPKLAKIAAGLNS